MGDRILITIVVPVYNEEECIAQFFSEMDTFIQLSSKPVTVCCVDDGSTDKSLSLIKKKAAKDSHYQWIKLSQNKGLSNALKAGIDHCKTPYLGYIDCDLQTSPKDFLTYYEFLDDFDLINGIRQNRQDTLVKKLSSKIANFIRRRLLNDDIKDTCCPLKIAKTSHMQTIPAFKGFHRFLPILVKLQGGKIKQVPISHFPRFAGQAKYNLRNRLISPFIDTLGVLWISSRRISYTINDKSE